MLSEKKFFTNSLNARISIDCINNFTMNFKNYFRTYRYDNSPTAIKYVLGLLRCSKGEANMERMVEEVDESEYRAYQHFITNSKWDCFGLMISLAKQASDLLKGQKQKNDKPTGLIIDESSHCKKGIESVGVSRQYAGTVGKVDNCQVGVYTSLVNGTDAVIINQKLFLPQSWINNKVRCNKAGIPVENQLFYSKPQLALQMIQENIDNGIEFNWIGGDGLYGHNIQLCKGIDELKQFFVLDVHKDETIFTTKPIFAVPARKSKHGVEPTKMKSNIDPIRLDKLISTISEESWKLEEIRDTTKGKLNLFVCKLDVWIRDGANYKTTRRTLIITKTTEKHPKIKFSISNGKCKEYTHKEYGYFVAQRYWVERTFDDAKNELGMSDYQTRKWNSWQHHNSLVMLASLFIMKQKIDNKLVAPILSFRDARILVILSVFGTKKDIKTRLNQMQIRHKQRQADIDRNYNRTKSSS